MSCEVDGKPGYKYGESGHCYTYLPDNEDSRKEAKRKAIVQGVAIEGGSPHLEKSDYADLLEKEQKLEPIVKDDENHLLFGWAYVAIDKDGTQVYDHSKEFVKEENFGDLEMATYFFNIAFRESDIRHDCVAKGTLIESMVFSKEKMAKMGIPEGILPQGVWLGFYFPDDNDWNTIKSMEHPMFSIYGEAEKEEV
jgi:hypothetical protein